MRLHARTAALIFITVLTASVAQAIDPDLLKREQSRSDLSLSRQQIRSSDPFPQDALRERQKRQREEDQQKQQDPAALKTVNGTNLEKLKLHSDTFLEYQFQPVPTLLISGEEFSGGEVNDKEEQPAAEEPQEQPKEDTVEASVTSDDSPEPQNIGLLPDQTATPSRFRIIEENNRIVVLQMDESDIGEKTP